MSENSDFTALESMASSLQTLILNDNRLKEFPNLPLPVRMNLTSLNLEGNQISEVPDDVITGYNLTSLLLNDNQITSLPSGFFNMGHEINLANNPLSDWDQYKWNDMMCGAASSLQSLEIWTSVEA